MAFSKFVLLALVACISAQDHTGTNYNTGDSGRSETRNPDGSVQGQYSYTDPNGKLITVRYRAGKDGFQVEGDHLPKAPAPVAPVHPQQQQQPQYNPHHYQPQQPQHNHYQQQPQQFNNFGGPAAPQQPSNLPASTFLSSGGNNNFGSFPKSNFPQQHPNAIPQPQFNNFNSAPQQPFGGFGGQSSNNPNGRSTVSVSQNPQGFSYTYQS